MYYEEVNQDDIFTIIVRFSKQIFATTTDI